MTKEQANNYFRSGRVTLQITLSSDQTEYGLDFGQVLRNGQRIGVWIPLGAAFVEGVKQLAEHRWNTENPQ